MITPEPKPLLSPCCSASMYLRFVEGGEGFACCEACGAEVLKLNLRTGRLTWYKDNKPFARQDLLENRVEGAEG